MNANVGQSADPGGAPPYLLRYLELVAWALGAAAFVIGMFLNSAFACTGLVESGDNSGGFSGTTSWGWLPPGRSCSVSVGGRTVATEPSWFSGLCFVLLVVWAVCIVARMIVRRRAIRRVRRRWAR